jgi:sodium transport system permease protein
VPPTPARDGSVPRAVGWWPACVAVFSKELTETVRDRRTLIAALVLPAIMMPLVVLVLPVMIQRQQASLRDRPARVATVGASAASLAALGVGEGTVLLVETTDARGTLLRGQIDVALVESTMPGRRPTIITVLYDGTRPASQAAVQKIGQLAARVALRDLTEAARARGANPATLLSIALDQENVATPERAGGALLATGLPLFVAIWAMLGGQYAALDVGVGERERGNLEALRMTPPARSALAAGKFLAVLTPAVLATVVMLVSALVTLAVGGGALGVGAVKLAVSPGAAAVILIVGVSLAAVLSASQLAVSLGARTLREAQQAFAALYVIVVVPVLLEPFVEAPTPTTTGLVPVLNAVRAVRLALTGGAPPGFVAVTVLVLIGLAVVVVGASARLIDSDARGS